MEYIHINKIEKYHPGYKDRELKWAKLYFTMVQGDPEFELIKNEIDKWRFAALICLELEAQGPLPNTDDYWRKKFDIKTRPMSLTLQMIHNFITIDTDLSKISYVDKDIDTDKNKIKSNVQPVSEFENLWAKYPKRVGKNSALRHWKATVHTTEDLEKIKQALANYLKSERVCKGYIQNGSTWFNQWQDWVDFTESLCPKCHGTGKFVSQTGFENYCDCPRGTAARSKKL